ncbi:Polyprenol-phosphate-mannose-dependent alpha-(1-2)-phosphatidylinositol pentamannoside mannosyltransferase [Mycobacterium talmoniae]|uniref:Polyprenol-phosphate-mannose-dependent alpha-(1-2)-phosphatidylinositol pentamannoside mannosyltransferase n=1 Tax=Mycobacterium talmoniae TaxID=1858794 RepID=A0A2S8BD89_9MYCO|nr:Polyprenol-phosphate-mannose-dependent alpha-(1-2)-phosphatidylinositol pentamannoside mannosyltransferase [Mycobacterium talmoniae]
MGGANRTLVVRRPALLVLAAWAAASVTLLVTTVPLWKKWVGLFAGGIDLEVYRVGAEQVFRAGGSLYDGPLVGHLYYIYTPFAALTFLPMQLLPHGSEKYVWMGINVALLVAAVLRCWQLLGYRISRGVVGVSVLLALICLFLDPVRSTLFWGQINLVLLLLVLWDTGQPHTSRLAGVGVGLAAGIKLTPAYFLLYYLALRRWRAAAVAVGTVAATIGLGFAVLPRDSWKFWTGTFFDSTRIARTTHLSNQSLRGALARLAGGTPPAWWWPVAALAVTVVALGIAVALYRGGERLLAVTVVGLGSTAVSPFSWMHHWVWFVPLMVYLVHRALHARWWWLGVAAVFVVMGTWPHTYPYDRTPRLGLYLFPPTWLPKLVVANLYLVVYAVILVGAAVIAVTARRSQVVGEIGGEPAVGPDGEQHAGGAVHLPGELAPTLLAEVADGDGLAEFGRRR